MEITQYKPTMNTTKIIYNLTYPTICPIFSKVMPKFTKKFGMTFAKKGTYGVPEFAGTEVNRRSGKFGYSICPFFSKGHAKIFREFWHDFAKNRTYSCVA